MDKLPLQGIRILDMTVVWAGPYAATLLADLGAEVIRIESIQTLAPTTRGIMARPPETVIQNLPPFAGGYPDRQGGDRPWNRSPQFNSHGRNKLSMTVDLRTTRGKEIFNRLVSVSDIFIDNNVAETMEKLGISYAGMKSIKEDIIAIRMPAYGDSGDYKRYRAFGVHMANALGHGLVRGYPDMDPSTNSGEFVVDAAAGAQAAAAAMMALIYRNKSGKGQLIELPSARATFAYLSKSFLEHTITGRIPESLGNRDSTAIQGCYPCIGDDRWIAITITNDHEWNQFVTAIGNPTWAMQPEFKNHLSRRQHHDMLDEHISSWTQSQDNQEAMHLLQSAGVISGPIMDVRDALNDPHLKDRNFYVEASTPDTGTYRSPTTPFKMSETPLTIRRGPVMLGQDNDYVYREVLGVSDAEFNELVQEGHIGTEYVAEIG